jgi:hypothetical protein
LKIASTRAYWPIADGASTSYLSAAGNHIPWPRTLLSHILLILFVNQLICNYLWLEIMSLLCFQRIS